MAADEETLSYYDANAAAYAAQPAGRRHEVSLERFLAETPAGGAVLDLGCGSGWASAEMHRRGYAVTAVDGSAGMVEEARRRTGLDVKLMRFDDLEAASAYDGVFASFSLLHLSEEAARLVLQRVRRALKPGGVVFVGMKRAEATGQQRDRLGRFYTYYAEEDLHALLAGAGLTPFWTGDGEGVGMDGVLSGHLYVLARRADAGPSS